MKLADTERVLRAVLRNVGAVCSEGGCDSKSRCTSLFSWVLGYDSEVGSEPELADVGSAEGCETTSLSVRRFVRTRATSSRCSVVLKGRVWGISWAKWIYFRLLGDFW